MTLRRWWASGPAGGPPVTGDGTDDDILVTGIKHGTRVWLARGVATRIVSFATNLVLIVLVRPHQLGLLVAVRGAMGLVHFASELGLEAALIRRHDAPTSEQLAALTGIRFIVLAVIAAGIAVIPGAATLFGTLDPSLRGWMIALTAWFVITPGQLASKVTLERNLEFTRLGMLDVTTVLLENTGLVFAALLGHFDRGVFVVLMCSFAYSTVVSQYLAPVRRISLQVRSLAPMFRETAAFSGASLFTVARASLTPIVVARVFGLSIAGDWAFAERICSYLNLVFDSYSRVVFAGAARLRHTHRRLQELATHALTQTATWVLPASTALVVALPVVRLILPKWSGAVAPGQVYALALGIAGTVVTALSPVTQATRGAAYALLEQGVACTALWVTLAVMATTGDTNIGHAFAVAIVVEAMVLVATCPADVRPRFRRWLGRPLLFESLVLLFYFALALAHVMLLPRIGLALVAIAAWQIPHLRTLATALRTLRTERAA